MGVSRVNRERREMSLEKEIEKRRKDCNDRLNELVRDGILNQDSYFQLVSFNNRLATDLLWNISIGRDLLGDELIESIDDLLKDLIESLEPPSLRKMFRLIMSKPLGARNSDIRTKAADLARESLESKAELGKTVQFQHFLEERFQSLGESSLDKLVEEENIERTRAIRERVDATQNIMKEESDHYGVASVPRIEQRKQELKNRMEEASSELRDELMLRIKVCEIMINTSINERKKAVSKEMENVASRLMKLVDKEKKKLKKKILRVLEDVAKIAENIYRFVRDNMEYISERREYLQPPLHTLVKVRGGDCDDLTLLLCSLWESIGYETTLNVLPEHCFPGVKIMVPCEKDGESHIQICNMMADPTVHAFDTFKFSYRLCKEEIGAKEFLKLPGKIQPLYEEAESHTVPPTEFERYCQPIDKIKDELAKIRGSA